MLRSRSLPVLVRPVLAPRLAALGLAAVGLLGLGGCQRDGAAAAGTLPARSNVLLITVDTLRADHLGSYGYVRDTSPVIDALAAEGVRFDQPVVQWPKTGPSFASIFTATYPKDNGIVRRIGQPLDCRFRMLAEELRDAGYQTHAVVANGAVSADFYFDQGFDSYVEAWEMEPPQEGMDPIGAEAITRLAVGLLEKIDQQPDKPWFLWVHYVDPHAPYTPPGEWAERFQGDEHFDPAATITITDRPRQQMMGIGQEQVLDGRDELAFYVARYDAEIRYNDHWIGELLEAARTRGLMERTLTVLTSDHGESLGEHGYYFDHGRFGFQTCLRVPLILHYPGVLEPRVDPAPVELIHLAPTILEAAGVALEEGVWMQGQTLTGRLRGDNGAAGATPHAFAEAGWEAHNKWQKIVRDERYKLIYAQTRPEQQWIGGPGVRFTLYDLENDPGETVNVAEANPEVTDRLTRELWAWERAERFPVAVEPAGGQCADEREMSGETAEVLKALGYL
ncbi:MAG TPA: sulfatase [Thermoanaerobaculia bacterium]|nr:sulfatase [Thermoanaerobaculia bacterium]